MTDQTQVWSDQRPTGATYQQTYDNIGKYSKTQGKPYIQPEIPMYVPNQGQCCVRIVDPIEIMQLQAYYMDVLFHRNVGLSKDYFVCTKEMAAIAALIGWPQGAGPCYRCDQQTQELWDTEPELAKTYFPEHRRLMWVLDLKNPAEANVLKLWSCPRSLSDEILSQSREPDTNIFKDICHPDSGVPVYFTRTGQGRNTKYSGVQLGKNVYPVGPQIAQQRFYFRDVLIWPKPGEIEASMNYYSDTPGESQSADPGTNEVSYETDPALPPPAEQQTQAEPPATSAPAETEYDYSFRDELPEDLQECFRADFDKYQECDGCAVRDKCQETWPLKVKKPSKTPKPDAPATTGKTLKESQAPSPAAAGTAPGRVRSSTPDPAPPADPQNASRIAASKEKLREEIEKRKLSGE